MNLKYMHIYSVFFCLVVANTPADAIPFTTTIGDNDGYGFGIPDNASTPLVLFDNRSAAELAAADGSQFTDFAAADPPLSQFDIVFPLSGNLTSGVFTVDVQGIQSRPYIPSFFNGILQPDLLTFTVLNSRGTQFLEVPLNLDIIAAANSSGAFIFSLGNNPVDNIAFDFFRLEGEIQAQNVPTPSTFALIVIGIIGYSFNKKDVVYLKMGFVAKLAAKVKTRIQKLREDYSGRSAHFTARPYPDNCS